MTMVGLVAPGSMGAAVGASLGAGDVSVRWASAGRSESTAARARSVGLDDAGDLPTLCATVDVLLSICPPDVAVDTAEAVAATGFHGVYVDANAIAPATTRIIADLVAPTARFVDGGLIGPPPQRPGTTRLYLAGGAAPTVAELFSRGPLEAVVLDGPVPAASALKVAYASWTKGSSALLLAAREYAAAEQIEDDLLREWAMSQPGLADRSEPDSTGIRAKAWRWVGEMRQIAEAYASAGLPDGFHRAAAEVYERLDGPRGDDRHER